MKVNEAQIKEAFRFTMGVEPRGADYAAVQALGSTDEALAEYIWDHWMGEPEYPTERDVLVTIREALK